MKQSYKFYIEKEDHKKLISKAKEMSYEGRGALSKFLTFIARNPIILMDQNTKTMLKALDLS